MEGITDCSSVVKALVLLASRITWNDDVITATSYHLQLLHRGGSKGGLTKFIIHKLIMTIPTAKTKVYQRARLCARILETYKVLRPGIRCQ